MSQHDAPRGRRAEVERLLQVLAVLREADGGWVPRGRLTARVREYAASTAATDSRNKMVTRDLAALGRLGFDIDSVTDEGATARDRLAPSRWRLPVELTSEERTLLSWITTTAELRDEAGTVPGSLSASGRRAAGLLVGTPPPALGTVHAALAGRRGLVVNVKRGQQVVVPVQLVVRGTRWFLVLCFPGSDRYYGYRLETLDVVRLGPVLADVPPPPGDIDAVLDALSWDQHPPVDVVLRCALRDEVAVRQDLPLRSCRHDGADVVLTGAVTNVEALVDRVLGLAGRVRVLSPPDVVERVVARARHVVEAAR